MNWFKNLKVSYKVTISCLILISLLIIAVFFSITSIRSSKATVIDYRKNGVLSIIQTDVLMKSLLKGRINMLLASEAIKNGKFDEAKKMSEYHALIWKDAAVATNTIKDRDKTTEEKIITERLGRATLFSRNLIRNSGMLLIPGISRRQWSL